MSPLMACFSSEMKLMAAYSSVSHINLVIHCIAFSRLMFGTGIYLVSLSHGYISMMLFYLVGMVSHRVGTRMVYFRGGVLVFSGFMFYVGAIVILSNSGVPPQLSFWGEVMLIISMISFETVYLFSLIVYFMFSFYYSVFLTLRLVYGSPVKLRIRGVFILLSSILPLFFVIMFSF